MRGYEWTGCTIDIVPGENAAVVAGVDNQVRLWDFNHRRAPAALNGHKKEVWGLAFSPDGRTLVSASDDHTLKLWDVASGLEQETLKGHGSLVTAVAYSPDGNVLASAGWDKTIRLWKASSGEPARHVVRSYRSRPYPGILARRQNLGFGGDDRTIRLWDMATRHELRAPLAGHTDTVFSVVFAPDGKTLYSGAEDKTIRLWDWKDGRLRATGVQRRTSTPWRSRRTAKPWPRAPATEQSGCGTWPGNRPACLA